MKIYLVGGAVRDKLLGLPIKERDWVVVGATAAQMLSQGFKQVGKDFPVFLHPKTHEEYALARVERKIAKGYQGFSFDTSQNVTLAEDLIRRDLTINAMAEAEDGSLIDPYHGQDDLRAKTLRHVSPAFSEDPVRILRVARFLARYAGLGFKVAEDTLKLMKEMAKQGEADALVPERVFKELERALGEPYPETFFETLAACDVLAILLPEIILQGKGMRALVAAKTISALPHIRLAALLHAIPENGGETKLSMMNLNKRYGLPRKYAELIRLTVLHHQTALAAKNLSSEEILDLLSALDYFRREERFHEFILVCKAIALSVGIKSDSLDYLSRCAASAKNIDIKALLAKGLTGESLAAAIKIKRIEMIEETNLFHRPIS